MRGVVRNDLLDLLQELTVQWRETTVMLLVLEVLQQDLDVVEVVK